MSLKLLKLHWKIFFWSMTGRINKLCTRLEIKLDKWNKEKVLIIDDLIATGGTAEAAAKLVEKSGGEVAGFMFVINLYDLGGVKKLRDKGYEVFSLIEFPGH